MRLNDAKTKMMIFKSKHHPKVHGQAPCQLAMICFTITQHKESGSSKGSTSDDDRSCDCCVCRM